MSTESDRSHPSGQGGDGGDLERVCSDGARMDALESALRGIRPQQGTDLAVPRAARFATPDPGPPAAPRAARFATPGGDEVLPAAPSDEGRGKHDAFERHRQQHYNMRAAMAAARAAMEADDDEEDDDDSGDASGGVGAGAGAARGLSGCGSFRGVRVDEASEGSMPGSGHRRPPGETDRAGSCGGGRERHRWGGREVVDGHVKVARFSTDGGGGGRRAEPRGARAAGPSSDDDSEDGTEEARRRAFAAKRRKHYQARDAAAAARAAREREAGAGAGSDTSGDSAGAWGAGRGGAQFEAAPPRVVSRGPSKSVGHSGKSPDDGAQYLPARSAPGPRSVDGVALRGWAAEDDVEVEARQGLLVGHLKGHRVSFVLGEGSSTGSEGSGGGGRREAFRRARRSSELSMRGDLEKGRRLLAAGPESGAVQEMREATDGMSLGRRGGGGNPHHVRFAGLFAGDGSSGGADGVAGGSPDTGSQRSRPPLPKVPGSALSLPTRARTSDGGGGGRPLSTGRSHARRATEVGGVPDVGEGGRRGRGAVKRVSAASDRVPVGSEKRFRSSQTGGPQPSSPSRDAG